MANVLSIGAEVRLKHTRLTGRVEDIHVRRMERDALVRLEGHDNLTRISDCLLEPASVEDMYKNIPGPSQL